MNVPKHWGRYGASHFFWQIFQFLPSTLSDTNESFWIDEVVLPCPIVWYLWHFSICVSSLQKCFWEVGDDFLYWNLLGNKLLKRFISVWISTWKFEENLFVLIHWSAWLRRRRLTTKSSTTKCQNECPKVNQELWASANKLWVSIIIKIVHKPPKKKKHVKKHIWKKFGVIIIYSV